MRSPVYDNISWRLDNGLGAKSTFQGVARDSLRSPNKSPKAAVLAVGRKISPFRVADVVEAYPNHTDSDIRSSIARLVSLGDVRVVGRGLYRLQGVV